MLDRYARATCIPAHLGTDKPPLKKWDHVIQLPGGCQGHVVGAAAVSTGSIVVEHSCDISRRHVIHMGEKSNPLDVRFDRETHRLYVQAAGSPVWTEHIPAWLVEYDMLQRRELQQVIVDPVALPSECPTIPAGPGAGPAGPRSASYWEERGRQLVVESRDVWRLRDVITLLSMADVAPFVPAMGLPEIQTCQMLELAEEFARDTDGVLERTAEAGVISGGRYATKRLLVQVAARCGDPFAETLLSWIVTTFPKDHSEAIRPFAWTMVMRDVFHDEDTVARRLGITRERARRLVDVVELLRRERRAFYDATEAAFRNRTRTGWQEQVYSQQEESGSSPFPLVSEAVRNTDFLRFWDVVEEVLDEKALLALLEWARTEARRIGMEPELVTPLPKGQGNRSPTRRSP